MDYWITIYKGTTGIHRKVGIQKTWMNQTVSLREMDFKMINEHQRIDAFKLWCWRRLLRVPWTARSSNQPILKEINPEHSLEGLRLKLKFQYFGHLIQRADSLEKVLLFLPASPPSLLAFSSRSLLKTILFASSANSEIGVPGSFSWFLQFSPHIPGCLGDEGMG